MAYRTLQQEYLDMPPITRAYCTACVLTTTAVQLDFISPFQIYLNPQLVWQKLQIYRLVTNFLFFGSVGFNFIFNMIFTYRYCRMLEEGSFRSRTADFLFMFIFGGGIMTICSFFVHMVFLSHALTIMLVYVWSRRNPYIRMSFFGMFSFQAPYLPWVLLAFSLLLGTPIAVDLMGIAVGHIYFYLEDVFPNQANGFKILHTPAFLKWIFDSPPDDGADRAYYEEIDEDVRTGPSAPAPPGGYDWGGGSVPPAPPSRDERGQDDDPAVGVNISNNDNRDGTGDLSTVAAASSRRNESAAADD